MGTNNMRRLFIVAALLIGTISNIQAQVGGKGPIPAPLAQGRPAGSYQLSEIENINYFSGNLNIRIPLAAVNGRGAGSQQVSVTISSPTWNAWMEYIPDNSGNGTFEPAAFAKYEYPGKVIGAPEAEVRTQYDQAPPCLAIASPPRYEGLVTRISVTMPGGTQYEFRDALTDGNRMNMSGCDDFPNRGRTFFTKDGSNMKYVADADIHDKPISSGPDSPAGYLYIPDGTVYRFNTFGQAEWMRDRNGNITDFMDTSGYSITDSVGRSVTFPGPYVNYPFPEESLIQYKGSSGQDREVTVVGGALGDHLASGESIRTPEELFPAFYQVQQYGEEAYVISQIVLPNGLSYEFKYNSYGELARIKLPTGGVVEYTWANGIDGAHPSGQVNPNSVSTTFVYRRLVERRLYSDGVTLTSTTTISRPETSSGNADYVDVKTYGSNLETFERHYYYGKASDTFTLPSANFNFTPWKTGREHKTEILDPADSSVLRTTTNSWNQSSPTWWTSSCYYCSGGNPDLAPSNNPIVTETTTELENGQVSKQSFSYDSNLNLTDAYEYDYGSGSAGPLLRRTHTDYLTTNPVNSTNYTTGNLYILHLPSAKWVSTDATGSNKGSLTQFEYDNYATDSNHAGLVSRSSVVGHDTTNFGTGFPYRGNLTGLTSYANAGAQTGAINAYSQFDVLGNVVKTIDGNGNATTISYSDNFGAPDSNATTNTPPSQLNGLNAFAFPTSTTNPMGPMGWTSYAQYDYFTGAAVNSQDINGLISKTAYNDALDRPTQTVTAIGTANESQASIEYDEPNRRIQSTGDVLALNDNLAKTESFYDGFGRTTATRTYKDGDYVLVETLFDALGRIKRVTNPYRPLRNEPAVWSGTRYDALGRVVEVEAPDGTKVITSYDGSRTLVTDQAGKQRISKTNALGELTHVYEVTAPDPDTESISFPNQTLSAGYKTTYSYDVLQNLTNVAQGVQARAFSYDSLSRLVSAANPESGTITYTHDSNGNLKTKRDARNVKTVYDYDVLNRLIARCYRAIGTGPLGMTTCAGNNETQEPKTSDVSYTYENAEVTYLKGVLTKVSSGISTTEYIDFDATGRVTRSKQTTDGIVYGDDTNPMTYTYSLSGALIEQRYPSGRVVKNVLDSNGELATVQSRKNANHAFWNYANRFTYNAAGSVTSMQLGNGRWESTQFNSRQQATQIALGSVQNGTDKLKLNYEYGALDVGTGQTIQGTNNGNVSKQTVTVQAVGATPGFVATQYYAYDALNRIEVATENILPDGQPLELGWRQHFKFDRNGNRNFVTTGESATTTLGSCPTEICNPSISPNDNKITSTGYTFDNAGNTTRDAQDRKFTYDAENKQTKVESLSPGTETVMGTIGEYFYDGDGRRVKKRAYENGVLTEETIFVYDAASNLVAEYSNQVASAQDAKVAYLTDDHLGSPRINTDINGNVTARHDYHPFGEEVESSMRVAGLGYSEDLVRKQFTGYERDSEAALDFAQARYYRSVIGRFYSADPDSAGASQAEPQSWNGYFYAANNPLLYVDPDGEDYIICDPDGKKCYGRNTDAEFNAARKAAGHTFTDGKIYSGETLVGTYRYVRTFEGDPPPTRGSGSVGRAITGLGILLGGAGAGGGGAGAGAGAGGAGGGIVGGILSGGTGSSGNRGSGSTMPANGVRGLQFERDALEAMGGTKNTNIVVVNGVATIPDAIAPNAVVEIKDARKISLTRQLRAQIEFARQTGRPFYLVVSPNTQRISGPLVNAIRAGGGKILTYYGRGMHTGKPAFGDSTNRY
jgi:RHS repeat-associated protein